MSDPHTSVMPAVSGSENHDTGDLEHAVAALEGGCQRTGAPKRRLARAQARGILSLVLLALLVGSAFDLLTLTPTDRTPSSGSRASIVFSNARSGACLGWPPDAPEKPSFVQCRDDHMFEVAKPVGMNSFGEPCQLAVREYLGTRYDPNSRFTISVLWAGDADTTAAGSRNLLCGLQLLGPDGKAIPFKGRMVELDQSKVWPVGTCLGVDSDNRSTDLPVDCGTPHGLEVTGVVSLAEAYPAAFPNEGEQRAFIDNACRLSADAYLIPRTLPESGYSVGYEPLSPASWSAGSRQVSCGIGRPAERGWTPMTGSARTRSAADLQPPAAPPPAPSPEEAPPPVYGEPLVPLGPVPTGAPAGPTNEPPPAPTPASSPTATTSAATPTTSAPASTPPGPPSPSGPAPGPATPPSESTDSAPGLIEIPGLPSFYLPGFGPPAAEPATP